MKKPIRNLFRWIVRMRIYSDRGMYWLPAIDLIIGVYGVFSSGIVMGILYYVAVRLFAVFIGYGDVRYVKAYQYSNEYQTRELNPYFKKLERKRGR